MTAVINQEFISIDYPFERMRVKIDGVKVSGSVRTALEQDWGKNTAKELYNAKRRIIRYNFHMVWWDGVERALTGFPKTFRNFITILS